MLRSIALLPPVHPEVPSALSVHACEPDCGPQDGRGLHGTSQVSTQAATVSREWARALSRA